MQPNGNQPVNQPYTQQATPAIAPVPGVEQQFVPPTAQPATPQPNTASQSSQQAAQKRPASTQNSLLLSEIRDGMVIMSDGSFRAVVACRSINFDLMSSREREGVEYSYQNFLNALYFPIQIFIRSQRVDIEPYLDKLEEIRRNQDNMLLNVLMDDYVNFIDVLSQEANIMDKSFFVVIPFFPAGDVANMVEQGKGLFDKIFGGAKAVAPVTKIDKAAYEKAKDEIKNRVDSVINGLMQVGIQAAQLNTKQLGELYYNIYNPDTAVREPLADFNTVTSTYVRKGGTAPVASAPSPESGGAA
ncbi:MAG: hypothetical protein WBP12_04240 [Candidatus Saccharimonas sp.]